MAPVKYIEFDSTYRDRNCYPCPAEFTVPVTCTEPSTGLNARDYIASGYPNESWYQVPYVGADMGSSFNETIAYDNGEPIYGELLNIPYSINSRIHLSLWPVNWNVGTTGHTTAAQGMGLQGTLISIDSNGGSYGDANFWRDLAYRSQNIISPGRFSGGTPSNPELEANACTQIPINGYLVGATIIKFAGNPAIMETNGSGVPLGSLGFPFYYKSLNIQSNASTVPEIGDEFWIRGELRGYVAVVYATTRIAIRLGGIDPIVEKAYPPYPSSDFVINGGEEILIGSDPLNLYSYTYPSDSSSIYSEAYANYSYTGDVETAVITSYDSESGKIGLSTPYTSLNTMEDYFVISFETNPTGIRGGRPRIFYPNGRNVPNFYTGAFVQDTTAETLGLYADLTETQVTGYDVDTKLLTLSSPLNSQATRFSTSSTSTSEISGEIGKCIGYGNTMSVFTILMLDTELTMSVPLGSIVCFSGPETWVFGTAQASEEGDRALVFSGPFNPEDSRSILNIPENTLITSICPPPWEDNYEYWKTASLSGLHIKTGKMALSGLSGSYSISTEGQTRGTSVSSSLGPRGDRRDTGIMSTSKIVNGLLPYPAYFGLSPPGTGGQFSIRPGAVFGLRLISGGVGYVPTSENLPGLLLKMVPNESAFVAPYKGLEPFPEEVDGVTSFLNICFVNIVSTSVTGAVLELSINWPGGSPVSQQAYSEGDTVHIVTGKWNSKLRHWVRGTGNGCVAEVTSALQSIAVPSGTGTGTMFRSSGVEKCEPGWSVYLPQFGKGATTAARTSKAPTLASYTPKYATLGTSGVKYNIELSNLPLTICGTDVQESGSRTILQVVKTSNEQILSSTVSTRINSNTSVVEILKSRPTPYSFLGRLVDVYCLGIANGFDMSLFQKGYALSGLTYLTPSMSFLDFPDNNVPLPGEFSGPVLLPTPVRYPITHSATRNTIRFLPFSRDSSNSMNYTGSWTSQNQAVCHEIELISLVLPNLPLRNSIGGLIAFYPFVYVSISNATSPTAAASGILYSNNPNAVQAVFRCAITNTPTPDISKFIKISGNGAVQTIKFKPNDALSFKVFLQDGTLFQTSKFDRSSPASPEPSVQISAQFSIRRVS